MKLTSKVTDPLIFNQLIGPIQDREQNVACCCTYIITCENMQSGIIVFTVVNVDVLLCYRGISTYSQHACQSTETRREFGNTEKSLISGVLL